MAAQRRWCGPMWGVNSLTFIRQSIDTCGIMDPMTTAQKAFIEVQKRQSTLRGEFNQLRAVETRSAEQDGRMTAVDSELTAVEGEFQTAADALLTEQTTTTAPGGEDAEAREKRELCIKANVGDVYNSILEKRGATDGATGEAQAAHGCAPNQIPLAMLAAPTEVRAVTPTPGASQTEQAETVQPVFATGAGAFLGIDRPTVAMGQAVYPVLKSRPAVGGPDAGSTDQPDTTGAFDADLLPPKRISAAFVYRRTDAMQFSNMDSALRMALNSGLQEKLDLDAIAGTDGLLTGSNLGNHNVSIATTFALYMSQFIYSRVDGRYATDASMLRAVVGSGTYAHMGSVYRANNVDDPAAQIINARTSGLRVSAHVPAVASSKQNAIIRLGQAPAMVQPVWGGVTIIVDEVTKSGAGEIEITAVLGMNTKIIRAAGFYKQQTQHA